MVDDKIHTDTFGNTTEPIAKVIEKLAEKIAATSNGTLKRVTEKLKNVSNCSLETKIPDNIHIKQYPPLFESLRNNLDTISRNLTGINECLDRVEL